MRDWVLFGVVCVVVLSACGSKDPDVDDGAGGNGGKGGRGGAGAGSGSRRDAGETRDSGEGGDGGAGECKGGFLPLAVGNRWTYKVINPVDGTSTKVQTIDGEEQVGGTGPNADEIAFHALTIKSSGAGDDMTESWQAALADGSVVRYREVAYKAGSAVVNGEEHWDPYKLRIDQSPEHLQAGATWTETYSETKIGSGAPVTASRNDGWKVDDVDVPCGPVRGEMLSCIKLSKNADGAEGGKSYWFARCVGKVREQGSQVEELTDYELQEPAR